MPLDATRRIDAVLLSHLHADHTDLRSLRRVTASIPVLAPPGSGRWLAARRIRGVREVAQGESTNIGSLRVTATPASHDGRRSPLGPVAEAIGFVVAGSAAVYFAGDTDLFPEMSGLAGAVDVALLPVSGWGPRLPPGHLDPERAARAAALILPRIAVPIHWGTFALAWRRGGAADPALPALEFARHVAERAPAVEVRVLAPGESLELPPAA